MPTISIHAPTRGATRQFFQRFNVTVISIHAPTRGATALVRDLQKQSAISIHAPTRGATINYARAFHRRCISIHAPTRGATKVILTFFPDLRFQSTLPQGERRSGDSISPSALTISIHAPTRGATLRECCTDRRRGHFNPRSHKGSDPERIHIVYD